MNMECGTINKVLSLKENLDKEICPVIPELRSFASSAGRRDWDMAAPKTFRDPEFGDRLTKACDGNTYVPPPNHGRLGWIKSNLESRYGVTTSIESVRKWFSGEMKPRPERVEALAALLEVDVGWLSLGITPDLSPRQAKARSATADAAVNVLAGFIQMSGGSPAFPAADDSRASEHHIQLYAIIRGAQYAFHVSLAREDDDGYHFAVPPSYPNVFNVGAIPTDEPGMIFVELTHELIEEQSQRRNAALDVLVPKSEVADRRIRTFGQRI